MKNLIIATNLTDDSTNVIINKISDFENFRKFAGGDYNIYIFTCFGWLTYGELIDTTSLTLNDLLDE